MCCQTLTFYTYLLYVARRIVRRVENTVVPHLGQVDEIDHGVDPRLGQVDQIDHDLDPHLRQVDSHRS